MLLLLLGVLSLPAAHARAADRPSFINSLAAKPALTAGTVPANGDQNPYGVAVVPQGFPGGGAAQPGDILVSNFNNGGGKQGMGTTIVAVSPKGQLKTFFTAPASLGPVGLTTALVALPSGLVIVGNTPTTDGTTDTISNGSLIFLDQRGKVLLNLMDSALLQGPWDMTADTRDGDEPIFYVSNVLSGTVTRVNVHISHQAGGSMPVVEQLTQIGSGFQHRTDPNALVVGPTGLLLSGDGESLYVADTGNNRIQVLNNVQETNKDRGAGQTVASGAPLRGPLALARSPQGTIVASNGDAAGPSSTAPNQVVEIDPNGGFVAMRQLDSGTPGAIFGIAIASVAGKSALIYVNDNDNTVNVLPTTR
jgi:hypothetical protein